MENKIINYLMLGFVFLILGTALIPTIATGTNDKTTKKLVFGENHNVTNAFNLTLPQINESDPDSNFTITNYPTGWKTTGCPITSFSLQNDTTTYASGVDYDFYPASGLVHMKNTTTTDGDLGTMAPNGDLFLRYNYCGEGYVDSGWGRTILSLVSGFFALALLGGSLYMFYRVFDEANILKK